MTKLFQKISIALLATLPLSGQVVAQQSPAAHYPGKNWEVAASPEELGLSREKLEKAEAFSKTLDTDAVMVVVDGKVAYQWGKVDLKINSHSVRKSVMSALYGKYINNGAISRESTMADLKINDLEGLSKVEKKATVHDLLKSRSGIYHPALYETPTMRKRKPKRHSHPPGENWYYNNWDFNALGTILKQEAKIDFFNALYQDIAQPIGMQDYVPSDGNDVSGEASMHNAYPFHVSARDLARFGWMMLNDGRWNDVQVVDSAWVKESTHPYSHTTNRRVDYGYMWWIAHDRTGKTGAEKTKVPDGSFSAHGARGQFLMVIPEYNMVVVHRCNSSVRGRRVNSGDWRKMLEMILDARIVGSQ